MGSIFIDETRADLAYSLTARHSKLARDKFAEGLQPVVTDNSQLRVEPLYLDKAEAAAFLSVSVSTFEKLLREDGTFPRPSALSANRNGYLVAELRAWGQTRAIADRLPPANTSRTAKGMHKATSPIGIESMEVVDALDARQHVAQEWLLPHRTGSPEMTRMYVLFAVDRAEPIERRTCAVASS